MAILVYIVRVANFCTLSTHTHSIYILADSQNVSKQTSECFAQKPTFIITYINKFRYRMVLNSHRTVHLHHNDKTATKTKPNQQLLPTFRHFYCNSFFFFFCWYYLLFANSFGIAHSLHTLPFQKEKQNKRRYIIKMYLLELCKHKSWINKKKIKMNKTMLSTMLSQSATLQLYCFYHLLMVIFFIKSL